jgi:transcriptional regulator with XRE-family HTH domain
MENSILLQGLAALRAEKNLTQDAVAAALGVSNKAVSKWETGAAVPETETLPKIADFFGVPIDALFSRSARKEKAEDIIRKEYDGLSAADGVLRSFTLSLAVIRGCISRFFTDGVKDSDPPVPPHLLEPNYYRSVVSSDAVYELMVNSDDVNLSVMLLPNKNRFGWITGRLEDYRPLFAFLADADALRLLALIHQKRFPKNFTSDYAAQKAGIALSKSETLLEEAAKLKIVSARTANLKEGAVTLYTAQGNGMLLSVLTLAYEYMCGVNANDYACHGSVKMIAGGEEK